MVSGIRIQITDTQLAGRLLDGASLLDQCGDGITDDLLAFGVVGSDQLIEVLAVVGAVDQGLQLAFGGFDVGFKGAVSGSVNLGHQRRQAWAGQGGAVDLLVFAQVDVANTFAVIEVRVVGVVAEAVVLVFGGVGFQRDLHALAGQLAEGQAAHAEQHLAQAVFSRVGFQRGAVVVSLAGLPLHNHRIEVADQQVGGGFDKGAAALVVAASCAFTHNEIAGGTLACTWAATVKVLAPEQEFDGVVAGGDVGFGAAQLIQAGQQFWGNGGDVELVFADLQFGVGDDVGAGTWVAQCVLVVLGDVVDQAFVQRPSVQLAFPVVDHGVAEAEYFGLHVRYTGSQPGFAGGFQGVVIRVGKQGIDGALQGFAGAGGVAEYGQGQVGVVADHRFAGGFIDLAGGSSRGAGTAGTAGSRCGSLGGWRFVFTATGE